MGGTDNSLDLKLLIDKQTNKVLFGEASKDFVDFIFSLIALPLGAVTKLLSKDAMVGSIGEVYRSLSMLNDAYILANAKVSSLLNPPLASTSNLNAIFQLPPTTHQDAGNKEFYICNLSDYDDRYYCTYVSVVPGLTCPGCGNIMNKKAAIVEPKSKAPSVLAVVASENKGYVKGVVTYSVMDDLTVVPMSTISSITLLNKFNIKDLGSLEEKTVRVGFEEGLKLLKASLQSKTVLTDVFLKSSPASKA